jgi:hypothetical protein
LRQPLINRALIRAPAPGVRHRMMHPWLPTEAHALLDKAARDRGLHPDVLGALVLEIVARENLFAAVIDA